MNRITTLAFALWIGAAAATHGAMRLVGFVEGIDGPSQVAGYDGWINLRAINQGVEYDGTLASVGRITSEFEWVKQTDATTPMLTQFAANGDEIETVQVDVLGIGGDLHVHWEMEDAVVTSLKLGDENTETVKFSYQKISYRYGEIDDDNQWLNYYDLLWEDLDAPPAITIEGTPSQFQLFNTVVVPEPTPLLLLTLVTLCMLRHR